MRFIVLTVVAVFLVISIGLGGSLAVGAFQVAHIFFYAFVSVIVLAILLGPGLIKRR